jgi:hypothetical protein
MFLLNIHLFFNVIGVDSMVAKQAKNQMKTDQNKKRKLKATIPTP